MPSLSNGEVFILGPTLIRDGTPWTPKGLQIDGFVVPVFVASHQYAEAYTHYGTAELMAARSWGADLLRFQVSQPGLDPQSNVYRPEFVRHVIKGVSLARSMGFTAIISMQAQIMSGESHVPPMPNDATQRAWKTIAPVFANDLGVIYELFNEPQANPNKPGEWAYWQTTSQQTIDTIRSTGARNVLIAEGLAYGQALTGAPMLSDPLNQVAYGVHPYLHSYSTTQPLWQADFGFLASTHVVIATEWWTPLKTFCDPSMPQIAQNMIAYLRATHVGLVGYAFDMPGTIVTDWTYAPKTFVGFTCPNGGPSPYGVGGLIQQSFRGF